MYEIMKIFRKPSPRELAAQELAEAELSRLLAHSAREYSESVLHQCEAKIKRLSKFLAEYSADTK